MKHSGMLLRVEVSEAGFVPPDTSLSLSLHDAYHNKILKLR